jgi:hypothetical protein
MGALARKCSSFFDWLANTHSDSLAEQLWKNEMILYASELYPELNNNELARLVDRDWKYMPEPERNVPAPTIVEDLRDLQPNARRRTARGDDRQQRPQTLLLIMCAMPV